jgi:nucleoside-diphosphate-sugar epimerase
VENVMTDAAVVPTAISGVEHLEDLLSEPTAAAIDAMRRIDGDVIVLGVAGKMGPTLARMARRATDLAGVPRRIVGVSRFGSADQEDALRRDGVDTIRCDLLDEAALARLPDAPNVIFMAGRKFGSTGDEPLTWAMNTYLPALVCRRYRTSRIVAFSTGNVYGLRRAGTGGSVESDPPHPVGEYAMSCLGRERMFEHFSRALGIPTVLVRLNYAVEMRYGVLADLARRVLTGAPIDVTMGYCNVIWQGDANAIAIALLRHAVSPALVVNVAGPEELSVREICEALARLMDRPVTFEGREAPDALLSNGSLARSLCGPPRVDARQLIAWTADWVRRGGPSLDKPTHFESRDGRF